MPLKSLEQIAKQMFSDYAMRQSGHYLDWRLLSSERKLAWLSEVASIYVECLESLRQDLSLGKLPMPGAGSYERGFVAGQAHEAHRLSERTNVMAEYVKEQLDTFILKEASRDAN